MRADDETPDHLGFGRAIADELRLESPDLLDVDFITTGPPIYCRAFAAGLARGATTLASFASLLNKITIGADMGKIDLLFLNAGVFRRRCGELFLKTPVTADELTLWFPGKIADDRLDGDDVLKVLASLDMTSVTFRVKGDVALANEQVGRTSAAGRAAAQQRAKASIELTGGAGIDARDAGKLHAYTDVCCTEANYCPIAADVVQRSIELINVDKKSPPSTSTASTASTSTSTTSSTSWPIGSLQLKARRRFVDRAAEAPKAAALKLRAALGLGDIAPRELYRSIIVFVGNPTFSNVRGCRPTPTKALLRALGQVLFFLRSHCLF